MINRGGKIRADMSDEGMRGLIRTLLSVEVDEAVERNPNAVAGIKQGATGPPRGTPAIYLS